MMLFSGCTTVVESGFPLKNPLQKAESERASTYILSDHSNKAIHQVFFVAATEGKKYGAKYFRLDEPYTLSGSRGAPLTNMDEIDRFCEETLIGSKRPRCADFNHNARLVLTYFVENNQSDIIYWNIDEVLADPKIKDAAFEYEIKDITNYAYFEQKAKEEQNRNGKE